MYSCRDATISGFNEYVENLQRDNPEALFTLTKFNSMKVDVVHTAVPISEVKLLSEDTYVPDGMTPLYDAIAQTVRATEKKVEEMEEKPNVLCVVMTDGFENTSKEWTRDKVFSLIKEKEGVAWSFVYLGADQDAWVVSQSIGFSQGNTMSYDSRDTKGTYRTLSTATLAYADQATGAQGKYSTDSFFHKNKNRKTGK